MSLIKDMEMQLQLLKIRADLKAANLTAGEDE
jgi:hypothetical protein